MSGQHAEHQRNSQKDENGFEYYLQDLQLDELGKQYVNDWLSGKEAEKRKQYLRDYTLNIELM